VIYFDAAFVAKFYLDEPESAAVRARAASEGEVGCCALGKVEVVSVFHRKWREKVRTKAECQTLIAQFEADCAADLWTWLPASEAIVSVAAAKYRSLPDTIFLRTLDAIHLACASEAGLAEVFTNDRHMLAAAPHFGLAGTTIS
jgi:predicted nucleic acid-binding protein